MQMQTRSDWHGSQKVGKAGHHPDTNPETNPETTLEGPAPDNRVVILEEALIEYIGRFGLTDKARAVFDLAPNDLTGSRLRRR